MNTLLTTKCVNCGGTKDEWPDGTTVEWEPIKWRKVRGRDGWYTFCSDGCEAVYLDFVKTYGWGL